MVAGLPVVVVVVLMGLLVVGQVQGAQAAEIWRDDDFARSWAAGDSIHDLLNFPRRMAAAIVAEDLPAPATIVDIGAGPGAVLAVFLERFPGAKGVWSDVSMSMLDMAKERIAFQGLPARICWVGLGDRHRLGLAFNEMVAKGELKAPIVIGRDHLDSGSVASPNRETESMKDGSDAVSDWPMLNALLNCASGATWVSLHHGGGVGIGYSQHAGMVIVADGTPDAARRLERVLWNDPATGVMRHADAGYQEAIDCAREKGLNLPSL